VTRTRTLYSGETWFQIYPLVVSDRKLPGVYCCRMRAIIDSEFRSNGGQLLVWNTPPPRKSHNHGQLESLSLYAAT